MKDIFLATSFQGPTFGVILFYPSTDEDMKPMDRSRLLHCYLVQEAILFIDKQRTELQNSDNPAVQGLPEHIDEYLLSVTRSGQVRVDDTPQTVIAGLKQSSALIRDLFPIETDMIDKCVRDVAAAFLVVVPKSAALVIDPCLTDHGVVVATMPYDKLLRGIINDVKAKSTEVADFCRNNNIADKDIGEHSSQNMVNWLKAHFATTPEYQAYFNHHNAPKKGQTDSQEKIHPQTQAAPAPSGKLPEVEINTNEEGPREDGQGGDTEDNG